VYFYLASPSNKLLSQDNKIIEVCRSKQKDINQCVDIIKRNNIEILLNEKPSYKDYTMYSLFYNDFILSDDYKPIDANYVPNIEYSYCNGYVYKNIKNLPYTLNKASRTYNMSNHRDDDSNTSGSYSRDDSNNHHHINAAIYGDIDISNILSDSYNLYMDNNIRNNLALDIDHVIVTNNMQNNLISIDEYWEPPNLYNPIANSISFYYSDEVIKHYNYLNELFSQHKNNLIAPYNYIKELSSINRIKVLEYALYINSEDPSNNNICKYFDMYWIRHKNKIIHACNSIIQPTSYGMNKNKTKADFSGKIKILSHGNFYWKEAYNSKYSRLLYEHYIGNKNRRLKNRNVFAFVYSLESIIRIQNIANIKLYDLDNCKTRSVEAGI